MTHDDQNELRERVRWTSILLFFADGSGLVSAWDEERSRAQQRGDRTMTGDVATSEHLRALAELRETGGCTNWIPSIKVAAVEPPEVDTIDWEGFESPDSEH